MANRIVKVGIIGCGGIANGKHMPSIKAIDRCDMVAFCDLQIERAKKAAKDGYLTQAQIDSFRKKLEAMPKTAERQQRLDALNKEVSLEKHQKAVAENKKKEIAAIDEAILSAPTWKLKNGESATYAAKNGKQVTITRNNGKIRYAIGKTYKEK